MRIILLHYAAPPVVGGVETVLAKQARLLASAGHEVCVLAGRGAPWDDRVHVEVIPLLDSRHPRVLAVKASLDQGIVPPDFEPLSAEIRDRLSEAMNGAGAVIAHNVASLHKNLAFTAALYELFRAPGSARLILWHHDLAWTTPRYQSELHPGWPWDLLRNPWPGAVHVVVSQARREELAALMGLSPERIHVIAAGVDLHSFYGLSPRVAELADDLHLVEAAPLLISPVRITRRKNLELGLKALAALRERMPAAAWVVTGPPGAHNPSNLEYFEGLKELRDGLNLTGAAHFLAERVPEGLPENGVSEFYRLADALLLPSREEGFGIPILEAGLAGLPIFCTDLPPLRALAGHRAAYFSPDEPPARVAALIANGLENDPRYQMRVNVRQNYTWEAVFSAQIAPLLEEA